MWYCNSLNKKRFENLEIDLNIVNLILIMVEQYFDDKIIFFTNGARKTGYQYLKIFSPNSYLGTYIITY